MLAPALLSALLASPFAADAGPPEGEVFERTFADSAVYPDTVRRYSVYIPAQYDASEPAALMVFQDGHAYVKSGGAFDVPATFDRLIADGAMPPTVAVLVDPGIKTSQLKGGGLPPNRGWNNPKPANRSVEYDSVNDDYARSLLDELLPAALKSEDGTPLNISDDPALRGICGSSSGGIAAFGVAWHRPNEFGKVISHIGSFTDIRGGHNYPPMIRKADARPIRVALQDGSGDLDNRFGNWWLANQQMAAALEYKDYDYKTWWGEGGHNAEDAGKVFADELRWLWRDWNSE